MVAAELQRAIVLWNDLGYGRFSLHFVRDKNKREVDFLIVDEGTPFLLVEAKLGDIEPAKALKFFQEQLGAPPCSLREEATRTGCPEAGNDKSWWRPPPRGSPIFPDIRKIGSLPPLFLLPHFFPLTFKTLDLAPKTLLDTSQRVLYFLSGGVITFGGFLWAL